MPSAFHFQRADDELNFQWDYEDNDKLILWWIVTLTEQVCDEFFAVQGKGKLFILNRARGKWKSWCDETHALVKSEQGWKSQAKRCNLKRRRCIFL